MTTRSAEPDAAELSRAARQARTNELLVLAAGVRGAGRKRLLDEVVVANIVIAKSIAGRFANRGIALEDLEQVACLALVRAADRYTPDKADDFLSYAVPTVRGENKRHFRDLGWSVRPPRRIQELQSLLNADGRRAQGRDESSEALAQRLGVSVEDLREARAAQGCFAPASLDVPLTGGGSQFETPGDLLIADDFSEWDAVEARTILHAAAKELAPRDRLVLYLRFVEGRSQAEIGVEIGVTQMQVSRLLARILGTMRAKLAPAADVA